MENTEPQRPRRILRLILDSSMCYESIITQTLRGIVKRLELPPGRWLADHPEVVRWDWEQELRDKADIASLHAAKRRDCSELRKKK
jgi:hypothetical protein